MLRRFAWVILPVVALGAGIADASMPATPIAGRGAVTLAFPAPSRGDRLIEIGATDLPAGDDAARPAAGNGMDAVPSDLGLAAAALANGPAGAATRRPAGTGQAFVTSKAKARLPEPATWVMLIGGMYGIGAVLRRRHRASEAAFTARVRAIAAERDDQDR